MIKTPQIAEMPASRIAYIRLEIPRERMPEVFPLAIDELVTTLTGQDVEISGPLFAHHLVMRPETFELEAGFPVAREITPTGRVQAGERPAVKVARTVYHGPYDGLPDAWGEFQRWVEESGHDWAPDIWECYLVGPETTSDPSAWRTELNRPLKS